MPAYQMFNLLIIPNGFINVLLSPVYAVIFGVGSMITGMAKVLCIPELIQITMLVLMLPVLLISFVMQISSRVWGNLKKISPVMFRFNNEKHNT